MRITKILFLSMACGCPVVAQTDFHLYEGHGLQLSPWLRYNKADGLLGGVITKWEVTDPDFFLSGRLAYGLGVKDARYSIGATKIFPTGNNEVSIELDYHKATETSDTRFLSDFQNSLGAILFKSDMYDYFETMGGSLRLGYNVGDVVKITAVGGFDTYRSLPNSVTTSLFDWGGDGPKNNFEESPAVFEGDDRWIGLEVHLDPRPSKFAPVSAWTVDGKYTNAAAVRKVLSGDFSYQRLQLDVKRYQNIVDRVYGVAGIHAASYDGKTSFTDDLNVTRPANQFLFDLGGLGSLRGYNYREFRDGNRMLWGQMDILFNGSFLPKTPLARAWGIGWIFKNFDLAVFTDAGSVWLRPEDSGLLDFTGLKSNLLRADAGVGLAMKNILRFDFAWVIKSGEVSDRGDFEITFRLVYDL